MPTFYENKITPITTSLGQSLTPEAHLHNHLEMVYLTHGQTYAFCDEQTLEMEPGDVFIAFPNQVHGYPRKGDGTAEHNIIIFSPRVCSEFKDLFHRMVPVCPLVKAKDLGFFRRFVLPGLGLCCCLFFCYAIYVGYGAQQCLGFLMFFAAVMAIGSIFYKAPKK